MKCPNISLYPILVCLFETFVVPVCSFGCQICPMASLQVDATPAEDVIIETEATAKEPQAVAPPPPPPPQPQAAAESVQTVDLEDEEDDLEDLTEPPHEEKVEISDEEEEKDGEHSLFMEREDSPPFGSGGDPGTFGDFNGDDFEVSEEDD
ncbi:hypothetical protein CDL12_20952 [Handroanthus impetiginosus]|uniref:Ubiquitinyl hydrolase 1 n=1 Tax=Handroanthus impetiginosus TaxID=429701 RepID=A0A2G9GMH4_9LAMI|nr:hypothetical protein CDL12_20952 [Handroanthus impetiginosus]